MKRAFWLVSRLVLRSWMQHPVRQALAIAAVALGVALLVSTELNSKAIRRAIGGVREALDAGVDLTVTRGHAGIAEDEWKRLEALPEFASASGVVVVSARYAGGTPLTLLGVEARRGAFAASRGLRIEKLDLARLATDPGAIVLTRGFLDTAGLAMGDSIVLDTPRGRRTFIVAGILDPPPDLEHALMGHGFLTLRGAQESFARDGLVDRVDLRLRDGVGEERGIAAARAVLNGPADVASTAALAQEDTSALDMFRGFFLLSDLLALVIAIFFVFNAVAASAAERVREAALWRALGMTRGGLLALILGEGVLLGLLGGVLGIALGLLLAQVSRDATAGAITNVMLRVPPLDTAWPDTALTLEALGLAAAAAVVATLAGALPLFSRTPLELRGTLARGRRASIRLVRAGRAGIVLLVLGVLALAFTPRGFERVLGPGLAVILAAGAGLVAPYLMLGLASRARRTAFVRARPRLFLAVDALEAAPARSALAVVASALALALVIAHGGVTRGMHASLYAWLDRSIPAQVLVSGGGDVPGLALGFPPETMEAAARLEGVERLFRLRFCRTRLWEKTGALVAMDLDVIRDYSDLEFRAGDPTAAFASCIGGDGVLISENLAWRTGLRLGDAFELPAPRGALHCTVAGILWDYHHQNGCVILHLPRYREAFADPLVDFVELCVARDEDVPRIVEETRALIPPDLPFLRVGTKDELLRTAFVFIDDLRALSWVQLLLAVAIGVAAVFFCVLLSVIVRARELALLRALGMPRRDLRRAVRVEVVLLVGAAVVVGLLAGNLMFVPANVLFRAFSGFTFRHSFPWQECVLAVLGASAIAVCAASLSVRKAGSDPPARALSQDDE